MQEAGSQDAAPAVEDEEVVVGIMATANSSYRGTALPVQEPDAELEEDAKEDQPDGLPASSLAPAEELEVTAEGTSSGPFGLKKVLFVRHKPRQEPPKPPADTSPSLNERLSQAWANFRPRGKEARPAGSPPAPTTAGAGAGAAGEPDAARSAAPAPPVAAPPSPRPQVVTEHFREATITFPQRASLSFGFADAHGDVVVTRDASSSKASSSDLPVTGATLVAIDGKRLSASDDAASVVAFIEANEAWPLSLRFRDRIAEPPTAPFAFDGGVTRRMKGLVGSILGSKDDKAAPADAGNLSSMASAAVPVDVSEVTLDTEEVPFTLKQMGAGEGVVVASIVGEGVSSREAAAAALSPGAVLLAVGETSTQALEVEAVQDLLAGAERPVVLRFRHAPPVYRPDEVEAAAPKLVHVATWFPQLKKRGGLALSSEQLYTADEWENMHETTARALRFLESFRAHGIPVQQLGMQTALLPRRAATDPYAGAYEGRSADLFQATRLWFCFPKASTFTVVSQEAGAFGLSVVRGGGDGSWIIVAAAENSACEAAGIPTNRNLILTHVNGFCVAPLAYRSVAPPLAPGIITFDSAIAPLLGKNVRVTLTVV